MSSNAKSIKSDEDMLNGTSSLSLHRSSESSTEKLERLIPLNHGGSSGSNINSPTEARKSTSPRKVTDNVTSVNNNGGSGGAPRNSGESGTTSMNPRSKRPKPNKPSSGPSAALLEAKRNAQARFKSNNIQPEPEITIVMKDHLQPARDAKHMVRKATGVVYDMKMVQHECPWDLNYPEKPERFSAVVKRCQNLGLLDRCDKLTPRLGTKEEVLLFHTEEHIEKLKSVCRQDDVDKMEEFSSHYDAIYLNHTTYDLSLLSVGCTVDLVDAVAKGKIQNGMAIIRPPGHHAMKSEYCGYCYFNNVAIAAKKALNSGIAKKVLIVDFDVHHGQATQQMFYDDPSVLYFSTHRFEHGNFWPNLEESNVNFIGTSNGVGFNCNVPLNTTGLGNTDFLTVWHQLLIPMSYEFNPDLVIVSAGYDCLYGCFEFNPDLVIVSAGYDSLQGDEKGEMELTPQCCPHLLWPLLGLAGGKVAVILEGGYCIKSLAEGAALTLRTLLGDPCPSIPKLETPSPVLVDSVLTATYMLQPYWKHLNKQRTCLDEQSEQNVREKGLLFVPEAKYEWTEPKPARFATRDCYPIQSENQVKAIDERLDKLILSTNLSKAEHKVGIVYDEIMLKHRNMAEPGHPERPERISNIFSNHGNYGLLERCLRLNSRESTEEELLLLHTGEHIRKMKGTQKMSARDMNKFKDNFNSIFFNNSTYQAALVASGSVLEVVDNVLQQKCQSGIAIVRPPGHHAEEDYPHGFCIFNNVALAAKYAIVNHGLKRVLIVDWDVHHGNGIQRMFEEDPSVLYISIHRYDHGTFFPCSQDADYTVVGKGRGEGFNVNIPWNSSKMGDTEYLAAFTNLVLPIAYQFNPELVFVSAGFDAARGDPLGGCKVTPEGYGHMTHLLSSLANGRVILALEGGYNLTSIAYSMVMCTKALLGDPLPPLTLNDDIHPGALHSIQDVLDVQSDYWSILKPFRKYLPHNKNLISKGKYEKSIVERMEALEMKNNNLNNHGESNADASCDQNNSESFISPERVNNPSSSVGSTPKPISPEAITMTLMVGDQEDMGASSVGASSSSSRLKPLKHTVVNHNFDDSGVAAVYPAKWCPHLEGHVMKLPGFGIDTLAECQNCGDKRESWICLSCYKVFCSRFVNFHMQQHSNKSGHMIALSFQDLSIWCYACETYLENEKCDEALDSAHLNKFGSFRPGRNQ